MGKNWEKNRDSKWRAKQRDPHGIERRVYPLAGATAGFDSNEMKLLSSSLSLADMRAAQAQLRAASVKAFAGEYMFKYEMTTGRYEPVQFDHIKAMEDALEESDRILAHWR